MKYGDEQWLELQKKKKIGSGSTAVQFTHLFEKETLKIKKKTTKQKSYYQIIFSYL